MSVGWWKRLPEQGPPSRCSTPHCQNTAVAVRSSARQRRWYCRRHISDDIAELLGLPPLLRSVK